MNWFRTLALALIVTSLAVADDKYSMKSYREAMEQAGKDFDLLTFLSDYALNAPDVKVARQAQTAWYDIDSAAAVDHFNELYKSNPSDKRAAYLYGRIAPGDKPKVEIGRKIIQLDAGWPWGYRLVCATYGSALFDGRGNAEARAWMRAQLAADEAHFATWAKLEPEDDAARMTEFRLQVYRRQWDNARDLLAAGMRDSLGWADARAEATLLCGTGKPEEARALLSKAAEDQLEKSVPAEQRQAIVDEWYLECLRSVESYSIAAEYLSAKLGGSADGNSLYNLACYHALAGRRDEAFAFLNQSVNAGFADESIVKRDGDLESLHADARWGTMLKSIEQQRIATAEKRRAEVLAHRIEKPAPDWTLEDQDGKPVKLSDLRGQVVILDFWATWCGPCKMAMPEINHYMKSMMPPTGVKVFSVNVWEDAPQQKPELFIKKRDYAMTLLHGTENLSKEYGFDGIPYLCAIDKQGIVRFEERGYSAGLDEKLDWWVDALLAE